MSLPEYIKNKKPVRVRNFPRTQTRKPSSGPPKPKTPTQKRKPSSGPPKPQRLKINRRNPKFDIAKKDKKKKNA
jgi:hypothetical protein|tara:strand:+ start:687 stop:908 length:222 start_codon:yes stop_codon:yes gene_type:complete